MTATTRALTYEDLCRAREDGNRYELIEGELILVASPSPWHQRLLARLFLACHQAVTEPGPGEVLFAPLDVRFSDRSIAQPDLVVVLADRSQIVEDALIEGPPSLLVEIESRSSRARDRGTKAALYARHGVPEYWAIDAGARVIALHADPAGGVYRTVRRETAHVRSETIPSLTIDLDTLFAGLPLRS